MTHLILSPSLIGGLYLILIFIFSGAVCVFVKLCVFYYRYVTAKPVKQEKPEPEKPKHQNAAPQKQKRKRTPVRKIVINPDEINKIYVQNNEK